MHYLQALAICRKQPNWNQLINQIDSVELYKTTIDDIFASCILEPVRRTETLNNMLMVITHEVCCHHASIRGQVIRCFHDNYCSCNTREAADDPQSETTRDDGRSDTSSGSEQVPHSTT